MAEFTVIETQEQLDRVIGERIRRAEEKAAERFADYGTIKTQNEELSKQIAQLTEQITKQKETIDGNKTVVDELNAKVQAYETASVKTRIALECGLPYQMAERLSGADEEAIKADAEMMVKLMGSSKKAAPIGSPEPTEVGKASTRDKFAEWVNETMNH